MIRELQERPFIHERIIDGHEEWIVSSPLRFVPVSEPREISGGGTRNILILAQALRPIA